MRYKEIESHITMMNIVANYQQYFTKFTQQIQREEKFYRQSIITQIHLRIRWSAWRMVALVIYYLVHRIYATIIEIICYNTSSLSNLIKPQRNSQCQQTYHQYLQCGLCQNIVQVSVTVIQKNEMYKIMTNTDSRRHHLWKDNHNCITLGFMSEMTSRKHSYLPIHNNPLHYWCEYLIFPQNDGKEYNGIRKMINRFLRDHYTTRILIQTDHLTDWDPTCFPKLWWFFCFTLIFLSCKLKYLLVCRFLLFEFNIARISLESCFSPNKIRTNIF